MKLQRQFAVAPSRTALSPFNAFTVALSLAAVLSLLSLSALSAPASASDWPQFRGPKRTGVSAETIRTDWPADGPPVLWRQPLGNGYSGISEAGDRLYTLYGDADGTWLVSLAAADGAERWKVRLGEPYRNSHGSGPRSTPTVAGGTVYAVSPQARLVAVDADSGAVRWEKNLRQAFGARIPTWGVSASPTLLDGKLLLDVGGREGYSVMALDPATGEALWGSQSDIPGYSTPLPITVAGQSQVVFFTGTQVVAVNPANGRLLWKTPWETDYDINAATPIFVPPNQVLISSGYGVGAALFRIEKAGDGWQLEEVWKSRAMKNQFSSSVLHDGVLYGFDDGTFKALDVADGAERWKVRGFGHGSLTLAGDHLVVLGDKGTLALVEATPEEYREKAKVDFFRGKTWTVPTVADGRLYLRDENEIVALDVAPRAARNGEGSGE